MGTGPHSRRASTRGAAVRCVLVIAGCGGAPAGCKQGISAAELRGAQYVIRAVEFEGVERFEPRELHEYLELRPRTWLPPERHWFYQGLMASDAARLVELYHAHGYYEAEVVDVRVEYVDCPRRDKVDLVFVIDEGLVTYVDDVELRWSEGPPPLRFAKRRLFRRAAMLDPRVETRALVEIEAGEPFEIPAMNRTQAALLEYLRRAGHPFAVVDERARVHRRMRSADVEFELQPGPFMRIGSIEIIGLETVPERPVRAELEHAVGEPYSPRLLANLEQRVYGLGVFSTVSVTTVPDQRDGAVSHDGVGTVALRVEVRESDPQRVRVGLGLGFEPNRWEQRVSARYSHENLFRALYKLRLTGALGWAELPNLINPVAHGPIARVDMHLEKKGLLEKQLVWTLDPRVELGIEQGYQFVSVEHRFGVSRFFTRWFQLRLNHTLRHVDFFSVSPTLDERSTFLGLDFRDPYIVSYIGVGATVFAVDTIAAPNDGVVLDVDYRVAGGGLGGQYDFQEIVPTLRGYWRPIERLQLAARARVGMIFPYGDQPGAPIDMRRYLGGSDTVRGWGLRRLAPRIDNCESGEDPRTGACESIPIGGYTSVLGNVEIRVRTWRDLWVAGFVDGGDVQDSVASFVPTQWNYSAGGGLRYDSPIGKFRLDVGVRLNDTLRADGEPQWAIHLGLGEAF